MFTRGLIPNSAPGVSWWVIHIDASQDLEGPGKIDWASTYVKDKIMISLAKKSLEEHLLNPLQFSAIYKANQMNLYSR